VSGGKAEAPGGGCKEKMRGSRRRRIGSGVICAGAFTLLSTYLLEAMRRDDGKKIGSPDIRNLGTALRKSSFASKWPTKYYFAMNLTILFWSRKC
jgi:hypothetical protein